MFAHVCMFMCVIYMFVLCCVYVCVCYVCVRVTWRIKGWSTSFSLPAVYYQRSWDIFVCHSDLLEQLDEGKG